MNYFEAQKKKLAEIIPPAPDKVPNTRVAELEQEVRDLGAVVKFLSAAIEGMRSDLEITGEDE